jgi:NhaP-type Na+/H+ or K+/H+ antiporter
MVSYEVGLVVVGVAILGAVALPRLLSEKPLSIPILYVAAGAVLFSLPVGVQPPDPIEHVEVTERLTELVVIIALMGAGLKLDRPFDPRAWSLTWRLLVVAMPVTIALAALLGHWALGALPATAVLLGAVIAPTDPVLASDVEASPPTEATDEEIDPAEQEGDVRFALTSEAGLNDGLAFPFTNLAIAMAGAATLRSTGWFTEWLAVDVGYKILVGVVAGYVAGQLMARLVFGTPATSELARVMDGAEALATTLITYGLTELAGGYGFIAVFVAALELRHFEWEHDYYHDLHDFAVVAERLLMAAVLVLFGGALVGGLLAPLTPLDAVFGLALLIVVRPLSGLVALVGSPLGVGERLAVSTFGIRGIGSFFYLSHALNEASFQEFELLVAAEKLWAIVGFVVLASIVLHGASAEPVMNALDRIREEPGTAEPADPSVD